MTRRENKGTHITPPFPSGHAIHPVTTQHTKVNTIKGTDQRVGIHEIMVIRHARIAIPILPPGAILPVKRDGLPTRIIAHQPRSSDCGPGNTYSPK